MTTKKQQVKDILMSWEHKIYTVNYALSMITGREGGVRWHEPLIEVSHSTVRRALDELVSEGKMESYYYLGHCYDELKFKKTGKK